AFVVQRIAAPALNVAQEVVDTAVRAEAVVGGVLPVRKWEIDALTCSYGNTVVSVRRCGTLTGIAGVIKAFDVCPIVRKQSDSVCHDGCRSVRRLRSVRVGPHRISSAAIVVATNIHGVLSGNGETALAVRHDRYVAQ